MPQKLVVALPMYRSVPVAWFFNWLRMDMTNVGVVVGTEAMYLPMAMEILINQAFRDCPDFDRLVILEHDMIPPLDAFNRIANYGYEHDIVGSVYFKHDYPHHIMAWMQVKPPFFSPLTAEVTKQMVESPGLYEVDGVAMGLTSIARHVLEDWDHSKAPMWTPKPPLVGHDLHFCNEAKKQGYKVWLDSGIGCGHLTQVPIGYQHSQEALSEMSDELKTWADADSDSPAGMAYDEGYAPTVGVKLQTVEVGPDIT